MTARIPAHLEVSALIRAVQAQGGFAAVLAKGERDAGTILILTIEKGGNGHLYERMPQLDGSRRFECTKVQDTEKPYELDEYLARLNAKLPDTMVTCFVLGLVPFLGLIPGLVYYRTSLLSSMRYYLPRTTGCFFKWVVKIWNLCLIGMQPVPVIGAFTLPILCLTNYWIYRSVFKRHADRSIRVLSRARA